MADQVNLTGSLAAGISLQVAAATMPRSAPEASRAAISADSPTPGSANVTQSGITITSEAAVKHVSAHLQQAGSDLKIQVDKATGRTIYQIINPNTGEVVLQVPSEELMAMARNLRAMDHKKDASGVLVDKEG